MAGGVGKDSGSAFYLNQKGNTVTQTQKTSVCAASCKCVFCERCAPKLGLQLREKLRVVFAMMQHVQMWTLTIDRNNFDSPKEAWEFVNEQRLIARLVRDLRKAGLLLGRHYVCVLECHKDGWPHWHLVLNAKFIEKGVFQKLWNRLGTGDQNKNFGFTAFTKGRSPGRKGKFASAHHAACYITKYLTKNPEQGWPEWVLEHSGRVRRFTTSRLIFKELGHVPEQQNEGKGRGEYKRTKSIKLRMKQCGEGYRVFKQSGDKWYFAGEIPHKFTDMAEYFGCEEKTLELPPPGSDPYVDCLFWAWLDRSDMPKCEIVDGVIEPVDWYDHPERMDALQQFGPPFVSVISTGALECGPI